MFRRPDTGPLRRLRTPFYVLETSTLAAPNRATKGRERSILDLDSSSCRDFRNLSRRFESARPHHVSERYSFFFSRPWILRKRRVSPVSTLRTRKEPGSVWNSHFPGVGFWKAVWHVPATVTPMKPSPSGWMSTWHSLPRRITQINLAESPCGWSERSPSKRTLVPLYLPCTVTVRRCSSTNG